MPIVAMGLGLMLDFYLLLIFVWVLGSWFPQWRGLEWYRFIASLVEPYINLFRGLRLQMGMVDLTPMAATFFLILVRRLLVSALGGGVYL